ncbi:hypothetical protein EWH99_00765 [Sporolactobacillus sp. THM7-7]|nr:hypothetical protein EWH99_00765 [Sporolactobacillus sp. THM7-7]
MTRVKNQLIQIFCIVFALFSLFILCMSVLAPFFIGRHSGLYIGAPGTRLGLSVILFLLACVTLLFFMEARQVLERLSEAWNRRVTIGLGSLILLLELALITVFRDILPPAVDGGHIYLKAAAMVEASGAMKTDDYFQVYPNNVPVTVLLYWIYRLFSFGNPATFIWLNHAACALFLNIGLFFSWKVVVALFNRRAGNLFLLLVLTCLPLFFYTLYFYSDTAALMFPPMLIYLWIRLHRTGKYRYLAMLGLALVVGCQIRTNLILFLPALLIYMLFVLKFRRTAVYSFVLIAMLVAAQWVFPLHYAQLGLTANDKLKMPATHWVMMGLSDKGRYQYEDYRFSQSRHSLQEKKAANLEEIKKRAKKRGAAGLVQLWAVKAGRTFADGSIGYYWYTGNTAHYSLLYDYIFGEQKQLTLLVVQAFHLVHFFLLALSAVRFFRLKKADESLLIQIGLFGSFLFYTVLWEAEPRYALLFMLPALIGDLYGLKEGAYLVEKMKKSLGTSAWMNTRVMLTAVLLFALCTSAVMHFDQYTQNSIPQKRYTVNQPLKRGKILAAVDRSHFVTQTFRAGRPFNRISIGVGRHHGDGRYVLVLREKGSGKIVARTRIDGSLLPPHRQAHFLFDRLIPEGSYALQIRPAAGTKNAELGLSIHGKGIFEQRDMYPGGVLYQNHRMMKDMDLQFQVYRLDVRPYLNTGLYILLYLIPSLLVLIYAYGAFKKEKLGEAVGSR